MKYEAQNPFLIYFNFSDTIFPVLSPFIPSPVTQFSSLSPNPLSSASCPHILLTYHSILPRLMSHPNTSRWAKSLYISLQTVTCGVGWEGTHSANDNLSHGRWISGCNVPIPYGSDACINHQLLIQLVTCVCLQRF